MDEWLQRLMLVRHHPPPSLAMWNVSVHFKYHYVLCMITISFIGCLVLLASGTFTGSCCGRDEGAPAV